MLSKLYRAASTVLFVTRMAPRVSVGLRVPMVPGFPALQAPARQLSLRCPKQYKQPVSKNFHLFHVLRHHWELCPLFGILVCAGVLICGAIYYGFNDRVDIQLTKHNWNCISRNMDLRHPTVHKHLTINQEYKPWCRMQAVLDRMAEEEAHVCPCGLKNCGAQETED